jgi:hypothetical protein
LWNYLDGSAALRPLAFDRRQNMQNVQHPTNNDVLRAPPGVSHDECRPAPITRVYYECQQLEAVRTHWQPTAQELAILNAGGVVQVQVWGYTMPPMYVTVKAMDDTVVEP